MIIVAGGDSFIYGSELQSINNTFTAHMSKKFTYRCVAWPGIGNDGIARRVINESEKISEKFFVIVSWTFPGRYEFKFTYDTGQKTREWYSITPWTIKDDKESIQKNFISTNEEILNDHIKTVTRAKISGIYDFAKIYYQHVGSGEYWEIYSTLKEIIYLQNYLKVKKIPYLFTCADNSILYNYTCDHADEYINSLKDQIDMSNWFWFPAGTKNNETRTPRGFYQWALENKYPMGTTHPLEQAHLDAATLIQEKFNELVKEYLE